MNLLISILDLGQDEQSATTRSARRPTNSPQNSINLMLNAMWNIFINTYFSICFILAPYTLQSSEAPMMRSKIYMLSRSAFHAKKIKRADM